MSPKEGLWIIGLLGSKWCLVGLPFCWSPLFRPSPLQMVRLVSRLSHFGFQHYKDVKFGGRASRQKDHPQHRSRPMAGDAKAMGIRRKEPSHGAGRKANPPARSPNPTVQEVSWCGPFSSKRGLVLISPVHSVVFVVRRVPPGITRKGNFCEGSRATTGEGSSFAQLKEHGSKQPS